MKTLYVAWQEHQSRSWFPVGRLCFDGEVYRFVYTQGAKQSAHFRPFDSMPHLEEVYEARELPPLFANRLLAKKRPEYQDWLRWLNLQDHGDDAVALLARTEGIRMTDSVTVFPYPEKNPDHTYRAQFFSHGIRYLPRDIMTFIDHLSPHTVLYLMPDPQNSYDSCAIALRTSDPAVIVGYCPRYVTADLHKLLHEVPESIRVTAVQVNDDAPLQLRLLCCVTAEWPENFQPCSGDLYQPLA